MPYCEKCGQKMSDDAVFCSKCGRKAVVATNNEVQEYKVEEYKMPESEATEIDDVAEAQEKRLPKKSKRIIFVAVMAIILVVVGLTLYFVIGSSKESKNKTDSDFIVTKNAYGEHIFKIDVDEYLNEYCYQVEQQNGSDMDLSRDDFEFVNYDGAKFYFLDMETTYMTLYADEDGENFSSVHIMMHFNDDYIPVGVLCMLRAFYPDDSIDDMNEAYRKAKDTGQSIYKDVKICLDSDENIQSWYIEISE